jgi:lipopolysaccharide/colanic/teichoic acid biosynthesis glycosyltransferase
MVGDVLRRLIDVAGCSAGLILLSPVLFVVAVLIKLDSPGPALYLGQRVGKDGRLFRVYKFRTMSAGAHRIGPAITAAGDPRITRVGRFLRRSKLDELPQLLNVVKGEMSLVGPRPEDPRYVTLYSAEQCEVLRVRPGITSAASLVYRDEATLLSDPDWERRYVHEILPHKLAIELEYLAHRRLASDLGLVVRTVLSLPRQDKQNHAPTK